MKYKIALPILAAAVMATAAAHAQKMTREEYIAKYKELALEHQDVFGIPASIKMAQALCESDNGNSRLAVQANNHFGIKCKKEWTGETISHDDDAKGECFRKYASAEESFMDHSVFLDNSPRYQDLFKLDPTDYRGWAYGLKAAGYATNPVYAEQLIKIIEDYDLHALDLGREPDKPAVVLAEVVEEKPAPVVSAADEIDVDDYVVSVNKVNGYSLYTNNGSEFVIAKDGDQLSGIASRFHLSDKKIARFNDLAPTSPIKEGDIVYVKAKNKRSANGKLMHYAKDGETLHSISQSYGIRLRNLEKLNRRTADMPLVVGQQIRLM